MPPKPESPGPPFIRFEDEQLLIVQKPAGFNTHAPSPFAGEGIYDWLRHREPRWARLAIVHRLDKETSGLMVFTKTPLANRSLTEQFAQHAVRKKYLLLTDREVKQSSFTAVSALVRAGEKYLGRPLHAGGERAETRFRTVGREEGRTLVEAEPVTGRTHQIRVQSAEHGFPILGDVLYGGSPWSRLCLHAASLSFQHPVSGERLTFDAPPDFAADTRLDLRAGLIDSAETNAFRLVHGASDNWPGWQVDLLGEFVLSQSEHPLTGAQTRFLQQLLDNSSLIPQRFAPKPPPVPRGVYHKLLNRQVRGTGARESSPQLVLGRAAPERFEILENGLRFELSFSEGYSVGLFLDQRDNRRRFLVDHVAADFPLFQSGPSGAEVLNTFAYTCGFSACAARAGARTTSIDLSKKYLEWGERNLRLNQLDPARHEFLRGDVFDWLRRLAKKGREFDVVILDPPTFSQSRERGAFRAEKDYSRLVAAALPLLKSGGVLFAATNAARFTPESFLEAVEGTIAASGRRILQRHFVPQPPDFPISRDQPGYLKTVWIKVEPPRSG